MKKNNIMRFFLEIVFISLFISCTMHHETEKLVVDIFNSNKENIDSTFQSNRINTSFFIDSILNGSRPSYYFEETYDFFNTDFYVVYRGNIFNRSYYSYYNDYSTILISIQYIESSKHANIEFKIDDNEVWQLKNIELRR